MGTRQVLANVEVGLSKAAIRTEWVVGAVIHGRATRAVKGKGVVVEGGLAR